MKKLLLLLSLTLCLLSCNNAERKTPLQWCLWEIHTHEDYNCEWSYMYNELHNYDNSEESGLNAYYITAFAEDRIGEWYCFIKCKSNSSFYGNIYLPQEVIYIDCDLARETILD